MAWLALTSANEGRRAGFAAIAGIALGLTIVGAASAFGLAQLASNAPIIFELLTFAGVAYLLLLAWVAWRDAGARIESDSNNPRSAAAWFRQGLSINLLNPKAAVFFISLLPTFVVTGVSVPRQILMLTATYVFIATAVHAGLVVVAGQAHMWLRHGDRATKAGRMSAILLASTALWLLISNK
jgi:threonine/homoserine/homoserine lactone efflux protein